MTVVVTVYIQCHTDLDTCCSGDQGIHRGDWFPPGSEERPPFPGLNLDAVIYESRGRQRVDLRRKNNASVSSGIYRCDIPTNAIHDDNGISVRESVYVGLHATGGIIITMTLYAM